MTSQITWLLLFSFFFWFLFNYAIQGKSITWLVNSTLNCTWKPISHSSLCDSCDIGFPNVEFPRKVMNFLYNWQAVKKRLKWKWCQKSSQKVNMTVDVTENWKYSLKTQVNLAAASRKTIATVSLAAGFCDFISLWYHYAYGPFNRWMLWSMSNDDLFSGWKLVYQSSSSSSSSFESLRSADTTAQICQKIILSDIVKRDC